MTRAKPTRSSASDPGRWRLSDRAALTLDRPCLLAILNVTPDSFHDGGQHATPAEAAQFAAELVEQGADAIDVGGQSTRPGARPVPESEQIRRVVPTIRAIRASGGATGRIPITIDTTRAAVARAALDAGADAINDVSGGLEDPAMLDLAAQRRAGIVLMHRLKRPEQEAYSDQYAVEPDYADVVRQVRSALASMLDRALAAGVAPEAIVLDPGLGFGKSVEQNLELVRRTGELLELGRPILSGASRKSFVGAASAVGGTGGATTPADRLFGTIGLSVMHWVRGARVFRVHDVRAHAEALAAAGAVGLSAKGRPARPG